MIGVLGKAPAFLLFTLLSFSCAAQLKPVYDFWKDDSVLKRSYYDRALKDKDQLVSSLGKDNKKDFKDNYESRFKIVAELLKSDRTVTAKEAHEYLQSILKKIVDANAELQQLDIRLVFSRDSWPNAYSFGEGTLVVNAGLVVFLKNEAELVFALCHELSHFYLDHGNKDIKKHVDWINSDELKQEIKRLEKEKYMVNKQIDDLLKKITFGNRRHSRDHEAEADQQAFQFMKKTGYDCEGIRTCLQLFDKIDDSLIYKPLNTEMAFNFSEYPFKKKWIQKESVLFGQMKEDESALTQKEKDSLKTHPDCVKRIALLEDSISNAPKGKPFMVNEELFHRLKKEMYVEITEQEFRNENIGRNLYYNLLMLQQGDNIPVAVYSSARDLIFFYIGRRDHTIGTMFSAEAKWFPADYNLLLRMLTRLRLEEIAGVNYYFCKKYESQMTGYAGFSEEMDKATKSMSN